jgi:hypothetical protein
VRYSCAIGSRQVQLLGAPDSGQCRSAAQVWTGGGAAKDEGGKAEAWSYLEIDDSVARRPSDAEIGCSDMTCGKLISRFTLQNLFFLVMAIRFSATAV